MSKKRGKEEEKNTSLLLMDDGFICKLSSLAPSLHLNEREREKERVLVREWRQGWGGEQAWAKSSRVTLVRPDKGCHTAHEIFTASAGVRE